MVIHDEKYTVFQPANSGMTPNGEIYVGGVYESDYSVVNVFRRGFFIHEMTHVWQYQLNILNPISAAAGERIRNLFDYDKAYKYELTPDKDLLDYYIEQQAQIIEDYYLWYIEATMPGLKRIKNAGNSQAYLPLYQKVLAKFLANPGYARHIIVCKKQNHGSPSSRHMTCTRVLVK